MSWQLALSPWLWHLHQVMPWPPLIYRLEERPKLSISLCPQSSELLGVSGEHVVCFSSQVQWWSVASHHSLPFLLSSLLCLTLLLWALQRQPPRRERERRKSCSSSNLCQALRLSSSGSLLCLHCFTRCLKLQLPGAYRYRWGGSACDVLIIRFAIT